MTARDHSLDAPPARRPNAAERPRWRARALPLILGALAGIAFALVLWRLSSPFLEVAVTRAELGETPVTVYRPADPAALPAPAVVIGHGFAGSQQLMEPFALTLAQSGYVAVTFDFLGHGRNPVPMRGDVTDPGSITPALLAELGRVVDHARSLAATDGRLALLGHSMASDIVVRYAQAHPEQVDATVAVSMYAPTIEADSPVNLLMLVGAWEPALKREAVRVLGQVTEQQPPQPGVTYGSLADDSARRLAVAPRVGHIGVLYSPESQEEALRWLSAAFDRPDQGELHVRGPWLLLLFLGIVIFARAAAPLLPAVADRPRGAGLTWRRLLPIALAPALLTPVILRFVPTDVLPVLIGDYLAAHFALYGLITAAGLWLDRRHAPVADLAATVAGPAGQARRAFGPGVSVPRLVAAAALVALYVILVFGLGIDRLVTSFTPVGDRWWLILVVLAGTLPFFLADEWLTRGPGAPRGGYAATKLLFALSLALAVAMDLERLFFLIIIVPVILVFFLVFGLLSRWTYRFTGHPLAGGLGIAVAFAWSIAVTFPLAQG